MLARLAVPRFGVSVRRAATAGGLAGARVLRRAAVGGRVSAGLSVREGGAARRLGVTWLALLRFGVSVGRLEAAGGLPGAGALRRTAAGGRVSAGLSMREGGALRGVARLGAGRFAARLGTSERWAGAVRGVAVDGAGARPRPVISGRVPPPAGLGVLGIARFAGAARFGAPRFAVVLFAGVALNAAGLTGPPARLAGTTPRPVNTPGFAVAATVGLPWFTDANCARLVRAARTCCVCAAVAAARRSRAAANCAAVGRTVAPPLPPL